MRGFTRYLKIMGRNVVVSLMRDLEYRAHLVSGLIASVGWVTFTLITTLLINRQTGGIGGWNQYQVLLVSGIWMINNGLAFVFMYSNMKLLIRDIHYGRLDFYLTKPVDSQFLLSSRRILVNALVGPIEGAIVVGYALSKLGITPQVLEIMQFIPLVLVAFVIYYSLWFIFATSVIHFEMADNIFHVATEVIDTTRYPSTAYPSPISYILTYFLPVLIMTTYPARQLLGSLTPGGYLHALITGAVILFIARKYWFWSLKRYSGASA